MVGRMRMSLLALGMAMAGAAPAVAADPAIEVGAGQAVLVTLSHAARQVVVGDPTVADVSVNSPRQVIVFGKRAGSTTLLVLDGGHRTVLEAPVVVQEGGRGAVTVTYGTGKDIKQYGGISAVFACATTCTRSSDKPASGAPPAPAAK